MSVSFSREPIHIDEPPRNYLRDVLIDTDLLGDACSMFVRLSIQPHSAIPVHEHHGDCEVYYILDGTGLYTDNGTEVEVSAGTVTFCDDGESHGIANNTDEPISMIALILKK